MGNLDKHWTNVLFAGYGILFALAVGILLAQLIFGSISFWGLAGFCLASVVSFFVGAGTKGSFLIGTRSQLIAGGLLGVLLIAGCLWITHWLDIVIVFMDLKVPGDYLIIVSALTGLIGTTKWDALRQTRAVGLGAHQQIPASRAMADLIGRLLGRLTGFEWRLYFVKKGVGVQYALHNTDGFALLGYLHARLYDDGERISDHWKLYLGYYPARGGKSTFN